MLEAGYKIVYEADSKVSHSHDLHRSFAITVMKYFDDTRSNQRILKRWGMANLLRLPAVVCVKCFKDILYILNLRAGVFYKLKWACLSPFARFSEFIGVILGVIPLVPEWLASKFSLVEGKRSA
jgi:hypothetical protein